MDYQASASNDFPTRIEWMWKSNLDPWDESQATQWTCYSDVENLIIEDAFTAKQPQVMLNDYYIDFKHSVEFSKKDTTKQRPVKRLMRGKDVKHLRAERFMPDPIASKCSFGGQYGWISPFIVEVRKDLKLEDRQLPSRDESIVPMIVENAALGITEEGKKVGKQWEAERMAEKLMRQKEQGMKEVWKCCTGLYSLESFLYKKLNETMRLIGSEEHEHTWRSKIRTFGPFALLLYDNPFNSMPKTTKQLLYRGTNLSDAQIVTYKDCSGRPDEYRSFQAFTSCSRNRPLAELYGNILFIMEVNYAYTVDLQPYSMIPDEEEELVTPGVCFTVQRVEFDDTTNKHLIYLQLKHRHSGE